MKHFGILGLVLASLAFTPSARALEGSIQAPAWNDFVAVDQFGGVTYPEFKLVTGAAGSATAVSPTNPLPTSSKGKATIAPVRVVYSTTNVTTAAYVQLIASTAAAVSEIEIFDSSGQTLQIGVGAAASEVIQIYVVPGGNGRVPLAIPAGTRVSIKAVSGTANSGEIDLNLYQ